MRDDLDEVRLTNEIEVCQWSLLQGNMNPNSTRDVQLHGWEITAERRLLQRADMNYRTLRGAAFRAKAEIDVRALPRIALYYILLSVSNRLS